MQKLLDNDVLLDESEAFLLASYFNFWILNYTVAFLFAHKEFLKFSPLSESSALQNHFPTAGYMSNKTESLKIMMQGFFF